MFASGCRVEHPRAAGCAMGHERCRSSYKVGATSKFFFKKKGLKKPDFKVVLK